MTASTFRTLLAAGGVMIASALAQAPTCTDEVQRSDSADYVRSVRSGVTTAYLNTHTVTFPGFVEVVRDRAATGGHPWDYLRRREDAAALRHFHVPLGLYPAAVATGFAASDKVQRILPLTAAMLACGLVVVVLRRMGAGAVLAGVTGLVLAVNPQYVFAGSGPSPHPWFIFIALVFLERYEAFLETGSRKVLLVAASLLALAFATLELAPALVVAAVLATFAAKPEWLPMVLRPRLWWRALASVGGVFLLVLFLAWPGGILRGGYLVSYGVFAAQALFERGELFPPFTLAGTYVRLFDSSALLVAVSAAGLALLAVSIWRRRAPRAASLFGLYGVVAFVLNMGNGFGNSTYAAEVMVFLLVAAGLGAHYASAGSRTGATAACVVLGLCAFQEIRNGPVKMTPADALEMAVERLPALVPKGATVLVNRYPQTFAAYLPQYRIEQTETESSVRPQFVRLAGDPAYVLLDVGPLGAQALGVVREHYSEIARFKSHKGASDLVLWRR
jgi:hypothetical protein